MPIIFHIVSEENGTTGANNTARLRTICKQILSVVAHSSGLVFTVFHGSLSLKYLFAARARFITSTVPSRNLNFSNNAPAAAGVFASTSRISLSRSLSESLEGNSAPEILLRERYRSVHKISVDIGQLVVALRLKIFPVEIRVAGFGQNRRYRVAQQIGLKRRPGNLLHRLHCCGFSRTSLPQDSRTRSREHCPAEYTPLSPST